MDRDYYITPEEYETAEKNGVSKDLLEQRLRRLNWSRRRAVNETPKKHGDHKYWYGIAKGNGINYNTFTSRISRGWEPERAATEAACSRKESGTRSGRVRKRFSKEALDMLEKSGIAYATFRARVETGWDEMEAASHPVISKSEAGKRSATKMKGRKMKNA